MEKSKELIYQAENRFKTLIFFLRIGGIPIFKKTLPKYYYVYSYTCMILTLTLYLATIMEVVNHKNDLVYAMKSFRGVLTISVVIWMQLSLRFSIVGIERLLELSQQFKWEDLPTKSPDSGIMTMAGWITRVKNIAIYGLSSSTLFHVIQSAFRIVKNRELIYQSWYPYNFTTSPAFEITNITQCFASIQPLSIFYGFPFLYATFVCISCSQLEKLKTALLEIKQNGVIPDVKSERDDQYVEVHKIHELIHPMQKQLNYCIRLHQKILEYIIILEDTMNVAFCGLFFILMVTICFDAFSAVTSWGDYMDILQALVVYIVMMGCIFVFCWLGTELTKQAESVKDAAWDCDWVGSPLSVQQCLNFMIAASNKEAKLTAGKFISLSNTTMMNMMNQSLSFFMFLLTMKDKNEEENIV